MKRVIQIGDKRLEKKSAPIDDIQSKDIQELIDNLLEVCRDRVKTTAGLSAPQIGQNLRVFIARRIDIEEKYEKLGKPIPKSKKNKMWEVIINPVVEKIGQGKSTFWEGCLSIKDVFGPVMRPSFVRISYLDRRGKKKELTGSGYFAHVLQHEIDHLDGVMFIKYVKHPDNLWKNEELDAYIAHHGKMPEIA